MGLERAAIVETALRLLNETGLDGLTLRRLAAELDVRAPALYWHFANKQELLDAMAARMAAGMRAVDGGGGWREALRGFARGLRATLNAYRDGARLAAGTRPSPELFASTERSVAALESAGFPAADAVQAMITLSGYVGGFVLEEQSDRTRPDAGDGPPDLAEFARAYPRLAAGLAAIGDPQGERSFDRGLELILDGLELRLRSYATREAGADQVSQAEGETAR
ncbi:TetR/AcrR family transcriptional regulator C-terminal domain-containing protein [Actinomadura sp. ATCC 31491]|uniref:TetR/AcrR family transcriptional regulator C-terminal domain-containing protein n=1 Tax=Actinomadura luzonensis TaxID=2805427 RepID=A0ABT0FYT3_9ACTN|nr:TetR/AcrR family transcriptional regulator C-terminal domain-containing protein [Actinomadura luzonensis]MCK2217512.1 TetR/AcrR family transcriptional regulator C-terminal domain-containing protein [Actinomadura luzonensis]